MKPSTRALLRDAGLLALLVFGCMLVAVGIVIGGMSLALSFR